MTEPTTLARVFRGVAIAEACSWTGLLLLAAHTFRWDRATLVLGLLASIPPLTTLWFERRASRRGMLSYSSAIRS
ncbi:MAG: DUF3817 domain-containing protein [Actinomycetota bacterium]|nr:DUF3817 domain-containing protein [Actinomycetota bacterium]